jgi:hypothetical protein
MSKQYTNVGGLKPGKSAFDLSYEKKFTCRFGEMIPVLCDEAIPGDIWNINNEIVVRMQPMITPMLHDVKVKIDYYFIPYRLLDTDWEDFITGGPDGNDESELPLFKPEFGVENQKYTTWDYLMMPVGIDPTGFHPIAYPWLAYESIWFEYYRDEDYEKVYAYAKDGWTLKPTNTWKKYLETIEKHNYQLNGDFYNFNHPDSHVWIPSAESYAAVHIGTNIKRKSWQKDYFTSARPDTQKGTSPAIPLVGTSKAIFTIPAAGTGYTGDEYAFTAAVSSYSGQGGVTLLKKTNDDLITMGGLSTGPQNLLNNLYNNNNTIDLGQIQGADINDIRNGFQTQKYLERNQRVGSRYTEQLQARWGIGGNLDQRLDRPEFIGGTRTPIIISEVIQTSKTDVEGGQINGTPQGNMAGHGITADRNKIGNYHVKEWGLIMGIMTIQPKLSYMSQGINKQWLRRTKYDFPTPEFVNLSEQPILRTELVATNNAENNAHVIGYQGIYDEARTKFDGVCADMRDTMDTWHMARKFDTENPPTMGHDFLQMIPQQRPFNGVSDEFRNCIVNLANVIKCIRPLPFMAEPGLIDHH